MAKTLPTSSSDGSERARNDQEQHQRILLGEEEPEGDQEKSLQLSQKIYDTQYESLGWVGQLQVVSYSRTGVNNRGV